MFTDPSTRPVVWSRRDGMPKPSATTRSSISSWTSPSSPSRSASCEAVGVGVSRRCSTVPSRPTIPVRIFVPPRSTPMTRESSNRAGYPKPSMAGVEKPYRVYRGGRVKGRVPLERPSARPPARDGRGPERPKIRRPRRRWSWKRRIVVGVAALLVLLVIWSIAGLLTFRGGVTDANKRLDRMAPNARSALTHQNGGILGHSTTILLLGTDHMNNDQRVYDFHSDSVMLLRTDPSKHRLAYLSIPRDRPVEMPGHGPTNINWAMQLCRPALPRRPI